MTAQKSMTASDFLAVSCRTVTTASDKRSKTITWDCTPGRVYYNYVIPGGTTQRKGCYAHDGIHWYENGAYNASPISKRYGLAEGTKCVKIQYRKNSGTWTTISDVAGLSSAKLKQSFTSTKNGDVYDIKVTYQVWTMGSPFRKVPFMWFGTLSGVYNEGANKFSQSSPVSPGRTWAGMGYYTQNKNAGTDRNSGWKITSYSWYAPNSSSKTTNWSYLHAKDLYAKGTTSSNGWLSTYACEKWLKGMPYGTDQGWTGNVSGMAPQATRKSSWWIFEKVYTDTYTMSGISERPDPLTDPSVTLSVINNLSTADSQGRYNGIAGVVKLTYKQAQAATGSYKLWAYQQDGMKYALVSEGTIKNNQTLSINVKFPDISGFSRSKNIAYYAEVYTEDSEYGTFRTGKSDTTITWTNLMGHGLHYFNDEPLYSSNVSIDSTVDKTKTLAMSWSACTDPDGHPITYDIVVCRRSQTSIGSMSLRVKSGSSYVTRTVNYTSIFTTSNLSYNLDVSSFNYGEDVDIYLQPKDKYYNDYYYANAIQETVAMDIEVNLNVKDNMADKHGDYGVVEYTFTHRKGLPATVEIYAFVGNEKLDVDSGGHYACKVYSASNVAPGTSRSITINFDEHPEFSRGYYIKYFGYAIDSTGETTYMPWGNATTDKNWFSATGYHYYNSLPTAVMPYITEGTTNMFDDNLVDLAWRESSDLEDHTIYYKLYVEVLDEAPYKEIFYENSESNPVERSYSKVIDLGSSTLPTDYSPYELDVSKYIGKDVCVWIKTYDNYNSKKYLSGSRVALGAPGAAPEVPIVTVLPAYAKNLYGEDKVDSENGYVTMTYDHQAGRRGTVYLHAICKKLNGQMKAFQNIAQYGLSSGTETPDIRLNFPKLFGNDWRTSEIRYYATAETYMGEFSEPEGSSWKPNTNMWDTWEGSHKFNEEPSDTRVWIDDEMCDRHNNIFLRWNESYDPDETSAATQYAIVLAVEHDIRETLAFIQGTDNSKIDRLIPYTEMWDTPNTNVNIDLTEWDDGQDFKIYIIPHDDYANSYYYMTEVGFDKVEYGRPRVTCLLNQDESERGQIRIKYEHDDLQLVNGQYVYNGVDNRDPARGDFDGTVTVYAFVDDTYSWNYRGSEDIPFKPGETKTIDIEFDEVCPYDRSHEIRYYVVATDKKTGVQNYDDDPDYAAPNNLTSTFHYYNDEPFDPDIVTGGLLVEEDRKVYGFNYVNVVWDRPFEPDGDDCYYYLYLKAPFADEQVKTTIVNRRTDSGVEPVTVEYTRKYRIAEAWLDGEENYSCRVEYETSANNYTRLQDNPFIGIRIDYERDHLGKTWPEKQEYTIFVEARDLRGFTNSYYGISEPYTNMRMRHEPPSEVQLEVIHNLTDGTGNGERGSMRMSYTHPEGLNAIVTVYAYQDGNLIGAVHSAEYTSDTVGYTITYNFNDASFKDFKLQRSKEITYYAEAVDTLVGFSSLDRIFLPKNGEPPLSNKDKLKNIPYLIPDSNGAYDLYDININGVIYSYNENGHYIGPVQKGIHYYNEEPPATTPELYDDNSISYKSAEIKWEHVIDPDGHDVSYELYVAGSDMDERMNTIVGDFYSDVAEPPDALLSRESEDIEIQDKQTSTTVAASGQIMYHKVVKIPASLAAQASGKFSLSTEEYSEDSTINVWIVSKDQYLNSYYRAGNILSLSKGHKAKDIRAIYPRDGSTVYATCPRILIYLGEDDQEQTTYVGWKDKEYNNRDHPEMFSNIPNYNNVIVFKPPVPYTDLSGTKVSYYVYAHNKCNFTDKKYAVYTYKDFFDTLTDKQLIALKSDHINLFRKAVNVTRDAYGLLTTKYSRDIKKGMMFENFDFNETKESICELNDLLNEADTSDDLDYRNPLIVNVNDLDVVEYEGEIATASYKEFIEWARLVYILQNL